MITAAFFERIDRLPVPAGPGITKGGETFQLNPDVVLSFNFTVMLQVDIQAGDVLRFQARNSRVFRRNTVIDH